MGGCRERRRLREVAGLDGKGDDGEDAQVGRCSSRAASAEDVCPAAADGYAVRSARAPPAVAVREGHAALLVCMQCQANTAPSHACVRTSTLTALLTELAYVHALQQAASLQ